jgi:hypothetical protein
MKFKLSDDVISQIAKVVQLAIVTGTDIVDNLRTLELVSEGDKLYVTKEYQALFEENISKMMKELNEALEEKQKFEDAAKKTGTGFFN